jgi:hypothetical protein
MTYPFDLEKAFDALKWRPIVYAYPTPKVTGQVFTKTTIQKQDDGKYRVSVTKFVDGNTDAVSDVVDTLEAAKKFVADNK